MIYVCSLYSNGLNFGNKKHQEVLDKRVSYTMKIVAEMLEGGLCPFSPILHCHDMSFKYNLPLEYDFWQKLDRNYIDHCSEVHVLRMTDAYGNWESSKGITDEVDYAKSIGKKITYRDCGYYENEMEEREFE